jgi:hypothetical protein
MKNFEALEQRHQAALTREAHTREEILHTKDTWKIQMLEMDAQGDRALVVQLATEIAEIERCKADIARFEGETGLSFDAKGPMIKTCEKCQAFFQYPAHICK